MTISKHFNNSKAFKNSNKEELEQIAFHHLSNIDFKHLMNLYKKCTAKPYLLLVIDSTLKNAKNNHGN